MVSNEEIKQALERKRRENEYQSRGPYCGGSNHSNANFCADSEADFHLARKKVVDTINLLGLSPAESMYLLDPKTSIGELIDSTFLDMLHLDVLEMTHHEVAKGVLIKKEKLETFVQQGSAFNNALKPHEEVFQKSMKLKPELTLKKYNTNLMYKLGIAKYHRGAMGNDLDYPYYRNKIRDQLEDTGYLEKNKAKSLGIIPRSHYQLTDYGKENKNKIESLLLETAEYNEENQQKNIIPTLETRMFLLNDDDMIKLQKFRETDSSIFW